MLMEAKKNAIVNIFIQKNARAYNRWLCVYSTTPLYKIVKGKWNMLIRMNKGTQFYLE